MIKVDIEQKLDEKRKTTITNNNNILSDVKSLMASDTINEKNNLKAIGLGYSIIKAEEKLGIDIERKTFEKQLNAKTFSEQEIRELCLKYDLRLLSTSYFIGTIEPSVGTDLTKFLESNNLNVRHVSNDFYIMAPPSAFMLSKTTSKSDVVSVDPVLFYRVMPRDVSSDNVKPYYVLVKKWGNDFTIGRLILGWMNRSSYNSFVWQSVFFSMILTIIAGLIVGPSYFFRTLSVTILFGTIISSILNSYIDGEIQTFKAAQKRFNINKWNKNNK